MKKAFWKITKASLLTLVAYIGLYAFWGAILSGVENPTLHLLLVGAMTSAAFGFILLYTVKIRTGVGEEEALTDYKETPYTSMKNDLKLITKSESQIIIAIAIIVLICFALNTFDSLVFERKVISFPTIFFAPLCLLSSAFKITAIGYFLSIVLNVAFYTIFLLIYRKKKYNYWAENKQ